MPTVPGGFRRATKAKRRLHWVVRGFRRGNNVNNTNLSPLYVNANNAPSNANTNNAFGNYVATVPCGSAAGD